MVSECSCHNCVSYCALKHITVLSYKSISKSGISRANPIRLSNISAALMQSWDKGACFHTLWRPQWLSLHNKMQSILHWHSCTLASISQLNYIQFDMYIQCDKFMWLFITCKTAAYKELEDNVDFSQDRRLKENLSWKKQTYGYPVLCTLWL